LIIYGTLEALSREHKEIAKLIIILNKALVWKSKLGKLIMIQISMDVNT